ncbi:hypothetical protein E4T43_00975 [Aureobasidium subglaciale]|nr:hypothetical protein E4T43_00975 [Aureobasidium subglaciale]
MLRTGAAQAGDANHHQRPHPRHYHDRYDTARAPSPGGDSVLTVRIPGHQHQQQQQHGPDEATRRGSVVHDRAPSDSSHWSHAERQPQAHGLANLNRWSHSTASSIASIDTPPTVVKHSQSHAHAHAHAHAYSNTSNHAFHTGSIWARRNVSGAQMSPDDVSPRSNAHHQAMQSPEYHRRHVPRFEKPLPPRMSISDHSPNDDIQLTAATFTPSSAGLLTPNSYVNSDYFGSTASSSYDRSPHALPPRTSSRQTGSMPRYDVSPVESSSGRGRDKDKKTMLSKALEKANTAVLLDNAMNYEGALEAYQDACRLLEHVLDRTSTPDDRRKLDAIRDTYTIRIDELLQIQLTTQATRRDKKLPPRPMSNESMVSAISGPDRSSAVIETATLTRIIDAPPSAGNSALPSPMDGPPTSFLAVSPAQGPRTSFLTSAIQEVEGTFTPGAFLGPLWERERSRSPFRDSTISHDTARPYNLEPALMPRPLTPRGHNGHDDSLELESRPTTAESQDIQQNADPVSWLDTIDESGSSGSPSNTTTSSRSPSPSVHERSPRTGVHCRDISGALSQASMDFDAAFDAAVEAAYEDGYEVDDEFLAESEHLQNEHTTSEYNLSIPPPSRPGQYDSFDGQADDDEAEEERILADITNDYIDHGFNFDIQSKSALPRQSDSSTYSGRTYQSSQVSNRTTAGTSLSTVAENAVSHHTPTSSFATDISKTSPEQSSGAQQITTPNRRAVGPNFKQLKIETSRKPTLRSRGYTNTEPKETSDLVGVEDEEDADRRISEVPSLRRVEAALASPYHMRSAASDTATSMSLGSLPEDGDVLNSSYRSPRPRLFPGRNKSSLSLRDTGFLSEETDTAPASPMSAFPGNGEAPPFRRYITPPGGSIAITRTDSASGSHHIFESFLNPPNQPPSPGADDSCSPSSLEPCPEPTLLRPFWMLRCIANVLNQPRGGFLSTRLFVPRQIWQNRTVKLKSVEDKIANCDLLTAALGKLSKVDTYDADAVLEELQSFEEVMERVQAVLIRRLGSEVGVQGVSALFKDAPVPIDNTGTTADVRDPKPNKSYLSSWRKLRGKNSTGGVTIPLSSSRTDKEVANMASVPMTSFVPIDKRTAHKHTASKDTNTFEGPHKEYMNSVSRLCDAAQVLDQVARQVEDPGLKHSSPTHIGLELSTRHAAEFFGFYICRFVLGDITLLMDKYVKRSTEWVIA